MEKMPFQPELERSAGVVAIPSNQAGGTAADAGPAVASTNWREAVPVLTGARVTLRELCPGDAQALLAMVATDEVARFISPPPSTLEGFQRFIEWAIRERRNGSYVCFAVVPDGWSTPVGLFQLRALEPGFATAEWGFALGSAFWGTGLFVESAQRVLRFAFDVVGVHRLEARASVVNGRGNGALRKLGAVQEGVLRRSFLRNGRYQDQVLWGILADEWRAQRLDPVIQIH